MKDRMKSVNKKYGILVVVIILLFGFRIFNLDADLPAWGIVNYQPMDEGQYATMALNKFNTGSIRLDIKLQDMDFLTSAHIRNNVIGNFFVYLGMVLFGDNYYGFRISSILFGGLNFILFGLILFNIKKNFGKEKRDLWNNLVYLAMVILLLVDFVFTVACRVVETTIYRMLFLQLIVYFFTINKQSDFYEQKFRFLLAGFLSVISVFAVYITNIFIPIAVLLTIIYYGICKGKKYFFDAFMFFVAGAGIAYVLCDLYYNFVWGTSCIVNTMQIITDFSGTMGYTGGNSILGVLGLVLNFMASNSNLYNIVVFYAFLILLPLIIKLIFQKKNANMFFIWNVILMLLLQTFINEDYIVRKYIIVYPLVFYLIYFVLISFSIEDIKSYFDHRKVCKIIYSIACAALCTWIVIYRLFFIENETYRDFSLVDKNVTMLQILFIFIAEILLILFAVKRQYNKRFYAITISIVIILASLITNIYFSTRYVYCNKSYTEKKLMQDIAKEVGEEWVYGIYSVSFTLYNDIKPMLNTYSIMGGEIANSDAKWYLDYSDYNFPSEVMSDENTEWIEKEEYYRNFSTFGTKRNVSLYQIQH